MKAIRKEKVNQSLLFRLFRSAFYLTHYALRNSAFYPQPRPGHGADINSHPHEPTTGMCNGISRLKLNEFFTLADNNIGTRGHSKKLVKFRCTRDCCKYFFSNRVINKWNQLDQRAVEATSINVFKGSLSKIRETRMGFFMD